MAINIVKYGNQTLIDLTDTTATASEVLSGYSFHDKTGALVQGSKTIDLTTVTVTPTNTTQVIAPGDEYYLNIENMAPTSTSMGLNPGTFWNISWSTQLNAGEIYHVTLDFYRSGYTRHYVYDDDITFNGFPFNITASSTSSSHNAIIKFNTTQISNSLASDDDTLASNRLTVSVFKESTAIGYSQVTVNGDADLISSNIKKNVDIFGVVGTYEASGIIESVTQDQDGYVILDNDEGNQIIVDSLSVTQNGTYTATTGHAYSPVTVNVSGITPTGTLSITQNGTYNVTNYASADVNVSSSATEKAGVRFIDYDGTVLSTYTYAEAMALSALPSNPSHTGLTAQGWNWSLADLKSELEYSDGGYIDVGQSYITSDGKTRLYITIDELNDQKPVTIGFSMASGTTVTVDWGDNTLEEDKTATSYATYTHEYASYGSYVISLSVSSGGTVQFGATNDTTGGYPSIMGRIPTSNTIASCGNNTQRLRKVELGAGVKIYPHGFNHCSSMETISVPNTLVDGCYIASSFSSCNRLKCFVLPSNVDLSENSFQYCTRLEYFPNSFGGLLGNSTFKGCQNLKNLFLKKTAYANGVGTIFETCYALEYASFPRRTSNTSLGNYTYSDCWSLKKMTMYADNNFSKIPNYMHNNNYQLQYVEIPSGVTTIGTYAFNNCYSLRALDLPNTVTSIDSYAFCNCYGLKKIVLPSTITTLGNYAFSGCYGLISVDLSNINMTAITSTYLFNNCYSLMDVKLPSNLTSIGGYMFYNCRCLYSIDLPSTLTTIGTYALAGCYQLASITVPNSVTTINNSAFRSCTSLTTIYLPSSVTTFGTYMFSGCSVLTHVVLPSNLTTIPSNTFNSCYCLEEIEIPNTVTSIGSNAFQYCSNLKTITIPNGVTSIAASAFASCTGMNEYHLLPTTPPTLSNTNAFTGISTNCIIYVPYSADHSILDAYQTASNWSTYASYMQEEPQ